jgi:hypothetical protein
MPPQKFVETCRQSIAHDLKLWTVVKICVNGLGCPLPAELFRVNTGCLAQTKSEQCHLAKSCGKSLRYLQEFLVDTASTWEVGQEIKSDTPVLVTQRTDQVWIAKLYQFYAITLQIKLSSLSSEARFGKTSCVAITSRFGIIRPPA